MNKMKVVIYTQPGCMDCKRAKMFLKDHNVDFVEKDIMADPVAFKELEDMGIRTLATVVIGEHIFAGFYPNVYEIKDLLGIS